RTQCTTALRKKRVLADSAANPSNRPFADLQDRAMNGREARESGLRLKAWIAPARRSLAAIRTGRHRRFRRSVRGRRGQVDVGGGSWVAMRRGLVFDRLCENVGRVRILMD